MGGSDRLAIGKLQEKRVGSQMKWGLEGVKAWAACGLLMCATGLASAMPQNNCADRLVGDSLAVGLGQKVQPRGVEVTALKGAGEVWLGSITKSFSGCSRTVVLFMGTNDLKSIRSVEQAKNYIKRVGERAKSLVPQRVMWVTPGCFGSRGTELLERGSALLDQAIEGGALQGTGMQAVRMRKAWCKAPGADGIHYTGAEYEQIWGLVIQSLR